jgi:hypothetical protein
MNCGLRRKKRDMVVIAGEMVRKMEELYVFCFSEK